MLKALQLSHHYETETLFAGRRSRAQSGRPGRSGRSQRRGQVDAAPSPDRRTAPRQRHSPTGTRHHPRLLRPAGARPGRHHRGVPAGGSGRGGHARTPDAPAGGGPRDDPDQTVLAEYGEVQHRWTALRGWEAPVRLAEVRARLDIAHLPDDTGLGEVSGGEQARVTLARVLLARPDVLILDEPTNHLDAEGVAWLGQWLAGYPGGSCSPPTTARCSTGPWPGSSNSTASTIGRSSMRAATPPTGSRRTRRWQRYLLDYEAQEKQRARWEADIAPPRSTPEESRPRFGAARGPTRSAATPRRWPRRRRSGNAGCNGSSTRPAGSPDPRPGRVLAARLPGRPPPTGEAVLGATWLGSKLGGRVLFDGVDLAVRGGDRILLTGRNGVGQDHSAAPRWPASWRPTRGEVARSGRSRSCRRSHDGLRTSTTVSTSSAPRYRSMWTKPSGSSTRTYSRSTPGASPLRTLSAGELRRLILAVMVNSGAPILLLDEPTNYLDFDSLDVIEEALRAYRGTLIMVTHDDLFASRVGYTIAGTSTPDTSRQQLPGNRGHDRPRWERIPGSCDDLGCRYVAKPIARWWRAGSMSSVAMRRNRGRARRAGPGSARSSRPTAARPRPGEGPAAIVAL